MNNFVFYSPTEFVFGKATEMQVGALARKHGARKVMIVYGGGSVVRSGLLDRVKQSLQEAGIEYCLMGGVQPNPVDTKVYEGIEFCRREQADMLLPVGGGSVIDTAKAIAAGVLYEGDFWDFYIGKAKVTKALKVAVVLTIPAAGSEGSGNTVITKLDGLQKLSLRVPEVLRPVFSIMNPELTYSVPARQSAIGGIDIFAHAFERYFHLGQKGILRDGLCTAVMKTVLAELPLVQQNPDDYDGRSQLMWAATMAHSDMIGAEGVFACHEMSHILTEEYDLSHGLALGILMPAWCKYILLDHAEEIAAFSQEVWDVPAEGKNAVAIAQDGISRFQDFICSVGLPVTLREAGISNVDSKWLAEKMLPDPETVVGENFQPLYQYDVQAIFELAKG